MSTHSTHTTSHTMTLHQTAYFCLAPPAAFLVSFAGWAAWGCPSELLAALAPFLPPLGTGMVIEVREWKHTQASMREQCYFCGTVGHGRMPTKSVRKDKCPAWDNLCECCKKRGHFQSICRFRDRQNYQRNSPASSAPSLGTFFCGLSTLAGVKQTSRGEWKLDHVEWMEECGWKKNRPRAMPKIPLDIEVMVDEHVLLHPQSIMKEEGAHTRVARNWQCTPDTGAQVTVSGPSLLSRLNIRQADLIPVAQTVSTANGVQMAILGAVILKLTSVQHHRSTMQLCYIAKECRGLYLSLSACKNLGVVHNMFPQPLVQIPGVSEVQDKNTCNMVTDQHDYSTAPCGCPIR